MLPSIAARSGNRCGKLHKIPTILVFASHYGRGENLFHATATRQRTTQQYFGLFVRTPTKYGRGQLNRRNDRQKHVVLLAGPGAEFSVIGHVPGGSELEATDCKGGWCRVEFNGIAGFVGAADLGNDATIRSSSANRELTSPKHLRTNKIRWAGGCGRRGASGGRGSHQTRGSMPWNANWLCTSVRDVVLTAGRPGNRAGTQRWRMAGAGCTAADCWAVRGVTSTP
jgi:hypothetical protein